MNCPSCGAPMHVQGGSLKCDYCGSVVVPERDSSGVVVLTESPDHIACPVCNVPLMQATLGRSPLLYCTKCCHGMLIAMMEFESLTERRPVNASSAPSRRAVRRRHRTRPPHPLPPPATILDGGSLLRRRRQRGDGRLRTMLPALARSRRVGPHCPGPTRLRPIR